MSAPTRLYIDKWNKRFVTSLRSTSPLPMTRIFYGDTPTYHIYILEPNPTSPLVGPSPYQVVSVANLSIKLALATGVGTGPTTTLASQNTWAKADDNSYLYADVAYSDAALKTALDAVSANFATEWFEIKLNDGGNMETVVQQQIDVYKRVIDPTTVSVQTPDVALSRADGLGLFVLNEEPAGGFRIRTSPNGRKWKDWVDDNGQQHLDELVGIP